MSLGEFNYMKSQWLHIVLIHTRCPSITHSRYTRCKYIYIKEVWPGGVTSWLVTGKWKTVKRLTNTRCILIDSIKYTNIHMSSNNVQNFQQTLTRKLCFFTLVSVFLCMWDERHFSHQFTRFVFGDNKPITNLMPSERKVVMILNYLYYTSLSFI